MENKFKGIGSGRLICINQDLDKPVLLRSISNEEMASFIKKYEQLRIEEYWKDVLLRPSAQGKWIEALNNRESNGYFSASYLTPDYLNKLTPGDSGKKGRTRTTALRDLPIEFQQEKLREAVPTTRTELLTALIGVRCQVALAPDLQQIFEREKNPTSFVSHLVHALRTNNWPLHHAPRYLEFLALLWGAGVLLYPQDLRKWTVREKWNSFRNRRYSGNRMDIVEETLHLTYRRKKDINAVIYLFFSTCDVHSASDLSPELLTSFENYWFDQIESNAKDLTWEDTYRERSWVNRVMHYLSLIFNAAHPEHAVRRPRKRTVAARDKVARSDGKFSWLSITNPELADWADRLREHVEQLTTARTSGQIDRLNFLGDYLCQLTNPPRTPADLIRSQHIFDASKVNKNTFHEFLRTSGQTNERANSVLTEARKFLNWYCDYLVASNNPNAWNFKNPILDSDRIGRSSRSGQGTPRNALPSYVINEMKEILTIDDFRFGKEYGGMREVSVVDSFTKRPVMTWYPGLTVCLYVMLETPLRGHQARWLDSGLLDEFVYDFKTKSEIPNSVSRAISGRRESVLRLQHDMLRSEAWLGLHVNTNKTASYDSSEQGYTIPYVSETCTNLLEMMIGWQKRYMPVPTHPLSYYMHSDDASNKRKILIGKGPQVVPLFNDPTALQRDLPIAYRKMADFYTALLIETQANIKKKYGHNIKLVKPGKDGKMKWAVDLHVLRVSGITAMIESGVPLEVVSQFFAGHATVVMTLHYLKFAPQKIRKFLDDARAKAITDVDFVGSELFIENLDEYSEFLLGQDGQGKGAGIEALKEKTGILTINTEGICPGTSCSTGGPIESARGKHGPVPGGRRCGLCRYWITGPAHLLGQVAAVNNLAYTIRKKGLEIADLNDERLDAEDNNDQKRARELRDRVEVLNIELAIDLEEWSARYNYASQSVSLMDSYLKRKTDDGAGGSLPMVTAGSADELKVTLESGHEFALLDHITQLGGFVTGFTNREALLEKNALLTKMMDKNGLRPFLLRLNDEQAKEAGNLLSSVILQQVRGQDIDDVLTGRKSLNEYPKVSYTIKLLEQETNDISLSHKPDWQRVAIAVSEPA